jgi:hypothetical protein
MRTRVHTRTPARAHTHARARARTHTHTRTTHTPHTTHCHTHTHTHHRPTISFVQTAPSFLVHAQSPTAERVHAVIRLTPHNAGLDNGQPASVVFFAFVSFLICFFSDSANILSLQTLKRKWGLSMTMHPSNRMPYMHRKRLELANCQHFGVRCDSHCFFRVAIAQLV